MLVPLMTLALAAAAAPQDEIVSTGPRAAQAPVARVEMVAPRPPANLADFDTVAWCHGALAGHMALAERLEAVEPLDEVQQAIGRVYLRGYEEALGAAPEARAADAESRARAMIGQGREAWTPAMLASLEAAHGFYLNWELPAACEHAAKRLGGPDVFALDTADEPEAQVRAAVAVDARQTTAEAAAPAPERKRGVLGRLLRWGRDD